MTPIEISIGQSNYEWWDLVPSVVGGVLGALAGGIPAWVIAKRASKETLARDRLSRLETELATVFRVHTKLSMMINDLSSTLIQIREMLNRPFDPTDESPIQRRVSAFAGKQLQDNAAFTADELSVFVAANQLDYLTELDLFGRRYTADMISLDKYGQLKTEIHHLISESDDIEFGPDDVVVTKSSGAGSTKLRMKARTAESIIAPLIQMMEGDIKMGVKIASSFATNLKYYFPNCKVPGFDLTMLAQLLPDLAEEIESQKPAN